MGIRHNLLYNSLIFPQMFIGHMCLVFCEVVLYIFCPFFPVIPFAPFLQIYSSSLYILDTNPLLVICIVITSFFFQFVTYLFLHSVATQCKMSPTVNLHFLLPFLSFISSPLSSFPPFFPPSLLISFHGHTHGT